MHRRILYALIFACFTSLLAFTQQSDDAVKALQGLERYREGLIPLFMSDFGNLGRYREANTKLSPPAVGENRVVFMGDSITDIWKLEQSFPGKPYVNRGIGTVGAPVRLGAPPEISHIVLRRA